MLSIRTYIVLGYIFLLGVFCSTPVDFALTVPALLAVLFLIDRHETYLDVIVVGRAEGELQGEILDALIASSMDEVDYARVRVLQVDMNRLEEAVQEHLNTDDEDSA